MKTMRKIIEEILKKYEAYYHTSFILKWNNQTLYSGFDEEEAKSCISLNVNEKEVLLLCKAKHFEQQLNGMMVALKTVMENESIDEALKNGLNAQLTFDEYELLNEQYHSNAYVLILVQAEQPSEHLLAVLKNMLPYAICAINDCQAVILLENKNYKQILMELKDTLEAELYCRISLAYSKEFTSLNELPMAYQQAKEYLYLMMKYDSALSIAKHEKLWLAYFVESLQDKKIEAFIDRQCLENCMSMDEELLNTIKVFLLNNLKLAETARQLYLHRNTLIYRLDKIYGITGLDIRNFDDALKMEILLLLQKKITKIFILFLVVLPMV